MSISNVRFVRNISLSQLIPVIALLIAGSVFAVMPAQAKDYDLVILNGRVTDPESGLDEIRNVGITDGKIAAVTKKSIKGKKKIDASGLVVANRLQKGN